jgi:cytochrome d ubiquinol oxidase subunit II
MLGRIVEGMPLQGGKYLGRRFGWFSPFSMLTGSRQWCSATRCSAAPG